jgi:glycerol kinase
LKKDGYEEKFKEKTGLVLDPYFSGTKITWLMENDPETARELRSGRAVAGTIDTYLIARLSGSTAFVTDASNASRTLAYDIGTGKWDQELLKILKIPGESSLPEVRDSAGLFGVTKGLNFLPDGVPITGVLGDQQAALAGQTCFGVGEAKCTYGTGAFLLLNLGEKKLKSQHGMLTTVAWSLGGRLSYAFEGSAFVAGAAVQFLRDQLRFLSNAAESEKCAEASLAAPEVYFVPALVGLGAPYWDPRAQGAFFGLTRGTTQGQLIRASLEGMAFQVKDLLDSMRKDCGERVKILRVDGGAAANNLLMQSQADFAGVAVDRPVNLETTAFGAALFAALGAGIFTNLNELRHARKTEKIFTPDANPESKKRIEAQLRGWERAVKAVQVFAGTK